MFESTFSIFNIIFIFTIILVIAIFIFTFAMLFSSKLRGKMMGREIKSVKHMLDESKDDIADITTTASNITIKSRKDILDQNEDTLKDLATRNAKIHKDAIESTIKSVKTALTESDKIYCKHCGKRIDKDSKFCKSCGKEQ